MENFATRLGISAEILTDRLIGFSKVLILVWFSHFDLTAGHIIGADLTYRCLPNGDIEITMKAYRDCFCQNCADFDQNAVFSIYRCPPNQQCFGLSQRNALFTVLVPLGGRRQVPAPTYECLENPPFLCVEEGLYQFRLSQYNIILPVVAESYYIVYQRCCRNITITNLIDPRSSGTTNFLEIKAEALFSCNSSAVFKQFPPTVICANNPLEFDHSAIDADGDSLSYRFCPPLLGGGLDGSTLGSGDVNSCSGVIPNPSCPPPFSEVLFSFPFSYDNPLDGDPKVRIDPQTGLITGTPTLLGQFVVGVCVDEWRDGVLINTISRDFQFNVASCSPTVVADIEADIIDGQRYFIKSCGSNTVEFINRSVQERNIRSYRWEFPQGTPNLLTTRNASVTFPDTGRFTGKLILNPGLTCSDSLDIFLDIFPDIKADFEFDYDTCLAEPVQFTDLSFSGSGMITRHQWSFNLTDRSDLRHPTHLFQSPGIFPVSLNIEDINGCRDSIEKEVRYFPVPRTIIIEPESAVVCLPGQTNFFNLSEPIDESYQVFWDYGDGNVGVGLTTQHEYERPGNYTVRVWITSPIGCRDSATFENLVVALPSPVADFTYTPEKLSNFNKTAQFLDRSRDAAQWLWHFGDDNISTIQNPVHTYADTGLYQVTLIVTHVSGCKDTVIKIIDVEPRVTYYLPNAFTPNGDGLNDTFLGRGIMDGARGFSMQIYNRWGELVFQTSDPNIGWNGSKMNSGQPLQAGVYTCLVRYIDPRGREVELTGYATLIR